MSVKKTEYFKEAAKRLAKLLKKAKDMPEDKIPELASTFIAELEILRLTTMWNEVNRLSNEINYVSPKELPDAIKDKNSVMTIVDNGYKIVGVCLNYSKVNDMSNDFRIMLSPFLAAVTAKWIDKVFCHDDKNSKRGK